MDENAVIDAVCTYLSDQNCEVVERRLTTQQGVDIVAVEKATGTRVHVEAKGATSSRVGSARYGLPYTQSQVFDRVAKGLLTGFHLRAKYPDGLRDRVVLAFPDGRWFRHYLAPIAGHMSAAGIEVFVVEAGGNVIQL